MRQLLLFLLLATCSLGYQQPKGSQPKERRTASKETDHNGRSTPPAINPQSTSNLGAESQNHQTEGVDENERIIAIYTQELSQYTRHLADYTLAVAFFTAVLVGVGVFQFLMLRRQANALAHHSDLIEDSVGQMRQAVAAYERYGDLTRESNLNAQMATELTRQSLILTHRPKLIIRNVAMDQEDRIFRWESLPGGGNPAAATGTLRIVNVGSSTAFVVSIACDVLLLEALPMKWPLPFDPVSDAVPIIAVPAGKYGTQPFPVGGRAPITSDELFKLSQGLLGLYVIGEIVYRDDLGNIRTTSFCREWRRGNPRFVAVENADYEHAD
jgi:hypothetical protein